MARPQLPRGKALLRKGRWSETGRVYLVTFTTKAREPLFAEWEPACAAARSFASSSRAGHLLCWVLMPDHWHGLIELGENEGLSATVRLLKGRSARATNRVLSRTGREVWDGGFHDRALRVDEDLLAAARYIVRNPVRAGLAAKCSLYPFWDAVWLDADAKHRG